MEGIRKPSRNIPNKNLIILVSFQTIPIARRLHNAAHLSSDRYRIISSRTTYKPINLLERAINRKFEQQQQTHIRLIKARQKRLKGNNKCTANKTINLRIHKKAHKLNCVQAKS